MSAQRNLLQPFVFVCSKRYLWTSVSSSTGDCFLSLFAANPHLRQITHGPMTAHRWTSDSQAIPTHILLEQLRLNFLEPLWEEFNSLEPSFLVHLFPYCFKLALILTLYPCMNLRIKKIWISTPFMSQCCPAVY